MKTVRTTGAVFALSVASGLAGSANAEQLDLTKKPPFLASGVAPNLILTMDESASMRSAWMPEPRDDECGWRRPSFYASRVNTIYFDPDVTYRPPMKADGSYMPDVNFYAAPVDGYVPGGFVDLSKDYYPTVFMEWQIGLHYTVTYASQPASCDWQPGSAGTSAGMQTRLPAATVDPATGAVTSPAFYYTFSGDPKNNAQVADSTLYQLFTVSAAQRQSFANWYSYYRTRALLARSSVSAPFAMNGDTLRIAWQNINPKPGGVNANVLIDPETTSLRPFGDSTVRQEFYDWLFKYRTTGDTPNRHALSRVGELFSRPSGSPNNPYFDAESGKELSCRQNFHVLVTDGGWNDKVKFADAYPGAGDVDHVAKVLPDGTAYDPNASESLIFGNGGSVNPPGNLPPQSGEDRSLADIAWHYWASDLRPDLDDDVPRRLADYSTGVTSNAPTPVTAVQALATPEVYFNPRNDPANWQHLVNYTVGLGVAGLLKHPDDYLKLRTGQKAWPTIGYSTGAGSSAGVDDTWHAAVNSRGDYLSATNPSELEQALSDVLADISDRQRGSVAAMSISSGVLTEGTMAYRGGYDTADWRGFLEAYAVTADGVSESPAWEAGERLGATLPDDRVIITSATSSGGGIPFRWNSLPSAYRELLDDDPGTIGIDDDGLGQSRLEYIRGDRTLEESQGGPFRNRNVVLGPIVHSTPVAVMGPSAAYDDRQFPQGSAERAAADAGQGYAQFKLQHRDRSRVLYVGANDGMLHAFDAGRGATPSAAEEPGDGRELWAYVPREVAPRLNLLTRPEAAFEPYVDSTPTVRDAFVNGAWRTILLGTMRRGGQGLFALDVTSATQTEAGASQLVLWEYADDAATGAQLGYTYGKPNIVRLASGQWAALLPGGYNNEEDDGRQGDGAAALFVINLDNGELIRRFDLPGTYGLSFATAGDYEGDFVDDFAVAGDADGNLWRFDFTNANPAAWSFERLFKPDLPGKQAITSAPRIFADPASGDLMLLFGTGRLLTNGDAMDSTTQSLYAIRENASRGSGGVTRDDLVDQSLSKIENNGETYYTTVPAPLTADDKGWRIDFVVPGERVINAPGALFTEGVVMVNTVIPAGGDPCKGGLRGSMYFFDAATGLPPRGGPYFDTNGDGVVDADDDPTAVGVQVEHGLAEGSPAIVTMPGGGAGMIPEYGIKAPSAPWRRRNWKDLAK